MTRSSAPANTRFPVHLAGLFLIMAMVVFCIWPGMQSPLFTDDIHQLAKSKDIVKWTEIFNVDVFGYYRPVKNALFLAAAPFETNLVAWHWIGLIAYLAATAGVFRIATICLGPGRLAWLATCFWALSPSSVSTVIWLSCANISIGLAFAACVFHFHERWADRASFKWLAACGIFFALSLLCYESLIAIPAVLFIRDLQQKRLSWNRQTVIRYGVYSVVALAFLVVRHEFSARNVGGDNYHPGLAPNTEAYHMTLSAPWFLWRHFLMWVFPFGKIELLGSYEWLRSASAVSLVFAWVFLGGLLAAAVLTWKRYPIIAFGLLFFIIASLPSGNFLPCFNGPINDAYVTIPSIGLAMVFAMACEMLIRQFKQRRKLEQGASVAIMAVLALLLIYRLPVCGAYFRYWAGVWGNPVELMLLTAETRSLQAQPKGYATILLLSGGYVGQAETLANEVIMEAPWDSTARLTLARISTYREDFTAAERYYRFILDAREGSMILKTPAMVELATILEKNPTRRDEAAQLCRNALKNPRSSQTPKAVALLARIYEEQGNPVKARATLQRGLAMHPQNKVLEKLLKSLDHPTTPSEQGIN